MPKKVCYNSNIPKRVYPLRNEAKQKGGEKMEISILDCLSNPRAVDLKAFKISTVSDFYSFKGELIPNLKLTPKQALQINMGDMEARNAFYFDNYKFFKKFARGYCYKLNGLKHRAANWEDFLQQIYADLGYYDFRERKTFFRSLIWSERTSDYGGICALREYKQAVKITNTISIYKENRITKDGNASYLVDLIAADEKSNPENMAIRNEEHSDEKESEEFSKIEKIIKDIITANYSEKSKLEIIKGLLQ